jgi:hypothetical protein
MAAAFAANAMKKSDRASAVWVAGHPALVSRSFGMEKSLSGQRATARGYDEQLWTKRAGVPPRSRICKVPGGKTKARQGF